MKRVSGSAPCCVAYNTVFYCPALYIAPDAAARGYDYLESVKGRIFYTWLDYNTFCGNTGNPKNSKVVNPSKKFMMVEVAAQDGGIGNTRYYWIRKNAFPHSKKQNVIYWNYAKNVY